MAHFAEIDENNIVLRVVVIDDQFEEDGVNWCNNFFGGGEWVQTSYNNNIRKNYAGIGFTYDSGRDAFIPPKPYNSWILDEDKCIWIPPKPRPENGYWEWNEAMEDWEEIATSRFKEKAANAS